MIPLKKEEKRMHRRQKKNAIYAKKELVLIIRIKDKTITVKDHCHYTGKYRGAVHDICNLRYIIPKQFL